MSGYPEAIYVYFAVTVSTRQFRRIALDFEIFTVKTFCMKKLPPFTGLSTSIGTALKNGRFPFTQIIVIFFLHRFCRPEKTYVTWLKTIFRVYTLRT